jgi:hypothetical protein
MDVSKKIFNGENYREKRAHFKASLIEYVNLSSYIRLFSKSADLNLIRTDIDIEPGALGADNKNIVLKYGRPDFIFNDNQLKIFVYKRNLRKLKIRYEIHFYNNKVFLVHYIYKQLNSDDKNYIVKTTARKYLNQNINETDIFNSKIIDNHNDTVFISNFLCGLKITYLSNKESGWFYGMTSEIDGKTGIKN